MKIGKHQYRPKKTYRLSSRNQHLMEIVVHSKNSLFEQKFHKKLYHYNRNSQLRSVM